MKSLLKHVITSPLNRAEKSLRHVAIAAKFLDDNKLEINLHCFEVHQSYSVSFNLSNVDEFFWG